MQIATYYRGGTDKITGFVFDTDEHSYKTFYINKDEWTEYTHRFSCHMRKENFKMAGDIEYHMETKGDVDRQLSKIEALGYSVDNTMILDFGIFKK